MASIRDIAQRAGVSIATVSRFINGSADVSREKEEKIKEALEHYSYMPSQFGRALRTRSSGMIGLVIPSSSHSLGNYAMGLMNGACSLAQMHGYSIAVILSPENEEKPAWLSMCRQNRVDGLIFSSRLQDENSIRALEELKSEGFPYVTVGRMDSDSGMYVYARYEEYTERSLDYLYSMGHRKILLLLNKAYWNLVLPRAVSYDDHTVIQICCRDDDMSAMLEKVLLEKVISGQVSAISGLESDYLPMFISLCSKYSIKVPDDVSVIVNDSSQGISATVYPGYTANAVPSEKLGSGAVSLLLSALKKVEGSNKKYIEYETDFVIRSSVRRLS